MTSTDPHRLDGGAQNPRPAGPSAPRDSVTGGGVVRAALWLVLVVSTVGNMVASFAAASTQIHLVFGAVTTLCVAGLVTRHLRARR
ncbi:hypothetical protein [Streptomyces daliensis]|uniref:Uncharacterized protein n=1 Tax=Streptomyces daliensis TaxID=299421 RepID=A0A8T4IQ35_9ACTN|nr:hypothetical protein [Streptomyces daliensis]